MKKKRAFITGITGQDGSYLAQLLLSKGYEVCGFVRRVALEDDRHRMLRLEDIKDNLVFISGSLESFASVHHAISEFRPDEVYHLAAQSFVSYSFDDEFSTMNSNINGTHYLLSTIKDIVPGAKFYFAASSEMFGKAKETPQNENTYFHPRSIYGISKVAGYHLTRNYREAYDIFACNGIMFNHESPKRGFEFVTRKITSTAALIKHGLVDKLYLGNMEVRRDWGHAQDYVEAMWMMMQQDSPDDFVIATGESHTVRELVEIVFSHLGLDYEKYVEIDKRYYRPTEVNVLCGDASKAKRILGWEQKISFERLVKEMVDHDMMLASEKAINPNIGANGR